MKETPDPPPGRLLAIDPAAESARPGKPAFIAGYCADRTPYGPVDAMLAAHQLTSLYERIGLSAEARAVIETVRLSPPTRRVRSEAGNVSVR